MVPVVLAIGIIGVSSARPLSTTLQGRLYIARMVIRNLDEVPLLGFGPGAFNVKYFQWETRYLDQNRSGDESTFRGPQDHAHNDYLELLTDIGPAGLAAFVILLVVLSWPAVRGKPDRLQVAALTGIAILLAIALVDFPLYRPTEAFLFWSLLALVTGKRSAK